MGSKPVEPGLYAAGAEPVAAPAYKPALEARQQWSRPTPPTRLPLGRTPKRLPFERRFRLWLFGLALPPVALSYGLTLALSGSNTLAGIACGLLALVYLLAAALFFEQLIRPLQTLSNVVAALREDDFSFSARGARRGDALGDLALEINALAGMLQTQRSSARDALTLVERVLGSMQSPVFAFDDAGYLRLLNAAARQSFDLSSNGGSPGLPSAALLGRPAVELGLDTLFHVPDQGLYTAGHTVPGEQARWSVRRAAFRLEGVPHTLLVLTDVGAALREEERTAWQRLIRVLGHEINNSLTPIKSIAGSLRARLPPAGEMTDALVAADLAKGLAVIEDRAASLNRFLGAYQRLSRLPSPSLRPAPVAELAEQAAALETRLPVRVHAGPQATLLADPDQLLQALINLVANGVEAALSPDAIARRPAGEPAAVAITWSTSPAGGSLTLQVDDNGPGITNPGNLFVPFYTTKANGSGIGLVLAQQIAGAHGGTVALVSTPGVAGCSARMTLPLRHTPQS